MYSAAGVYYTTLLCFSPALGQGWRVGFLGLLHMEVFNQRLEQEYGALAIVTAPSVTYKGKSRYGYSENISFLFAFISVLIV